MERIVRMRTIQQTVDMIKYMDSNSCITYNCILNLCKRNAVRHAKTGRKYLVCVESVLEYFGLVEV